MPSKAKQRLLKRGGKRLSGGRVSWQLHARYSQSMIEATQLAWTTGQPFNRYITLLWERGGIKARDNASATAHFVKLASDWARRHGFRLIWAWVQEYGHANGAHVHLLLHVPPELDWQFRPMPMRWAKAVLPGDYVAGLLQCQKPDKTLGHWRWLWGKVHYMLKCSPEHLEADLQMCGLGPKPWGQRCAVYGKRLGVWQNRRSIK